MWLDNKHISDIGVPHKRGNAALNSLSGAVSQISSLNSQIETVIRSKYTVNTQASHSVLLYFYIYVYIFLTWPLKLYV